LYSAARTHDTIDPALFDEGVEINGVTWATRNVGEPGKFAATPEDPGMFYQFNRKTGWSATGTLISSPAGAVWNSTGDASTVWEPKNDPCPAGWHVPTKAQFNALIAFDLGWDDTKKGRTFGITPNTIFLSAASIRNQSSVFEYANSGLYWTNEGLSGNSSLVCFNSSDCYTSVIYQGCSLSIRCVKK
jgi:uncharacterized protein (TIGR02145 family)